LSKAQHKASRAKAITQNGKKLRMLTLLGPFTICDVEGEKGFQKRIEPEEQELQYTKSANIYFTLNGDTPEMSINQ